jgi:hypothetical protein
MLNQKEIPAILKSLISIYVFDYARPFEYFNFETGALVSKTIFSNSGLNIIGYLLDFESITYTRNKAYLPK